MLQVCIVDLLLPINRMQPLAKAPEQAEIRPLRQQELSTVLDTSPTAFLPSHTQQHSLGRNTIIS